MSLVRRYGDTDFITALRAIAALLVVVTHTGAFYDWGSWGILLSRNAAAGVMVFFVISGFTIAKTFNSAPSYKHFLIRRLFRIAPTYYLVVSIAFLLIFAHVLKPVYWADVFHTEFNLRNFLLHIGFLSFTDMSTANSILGVEWSIPVEVIWYLLLPAILLGAGNRQRFLFFFILFIAIDIATRLYATKYIAYGYNVFIDWSPSSYAYCFLLGAIAYNLRTNDMLADKVNVAMLAIAGASFLAGLLAAKPLSPVLLSLATFLFITGFRADRFPRLASVLTSTPLLYLGSVSYSIYLTHYIILLALHQYAANTFGKTGPVLFLVVVSGAVFAATLLYILVERPSNRLGKRLADRWFGAKGRSSVEA